MRAGLDATTSRSWSSQVTLGGDAMSATVSISFACEPFTISSTTAADCAILAKASFVLPVRHDAQPDGRDRNRD